MREPPLSSFFSYKKIQYSVGLESPKVRNNDVIDHDYNQNIPKIRFLYKKRLQS